MVDDKDEQYDGEEDEYHFSDDQVNYEIDSDTSAKDFPAASRNMKDVILNKLNQHRKILIGSIIFLVLIGVVYKIVVPSSTTPSTEFAENNAAAMPKKTTNYPSVATNAPVTNPTIPSASSPQSTNPVNQPQEPSRPSEATNGTLAGFIAGQPTQQASQPTQGMQQSNPVSSTAQSSSAVQGNLPGQSIVSSANNATPSSVQPQAVGQGTQTAASSPPQNVPATFTSSGASAPVQTPMQQAEAQSSMQQAQTGIPVGENTTAAQNVTTQAAPAELTNRVSSLEQQNTAVMNLLQTEYAQKISDNETQNLALRGKMEELTKRLNRIESTLNQMTQMIQGTVRQSQIGMTGSAPGVVMESVPAMSSKMGPKITYSVQAIIPGRAWLKSDTGDTVTVAEGDILRGFGRVIKIDPYDGIVNIDMGNKVLTLSYGMSAD